MRRRNKSAKVRAAMFLTYRTLTRPRSPTSSFVLPLHLPHSASPTTPAATLALTLSTTLPRASRMCAPGRSEVSCSARPASATRCVSRLHLLSRTLTHPKTTIFKQAIELGAQPLHNLTDKVTHLLALEPGSPKYKVRRVPLCPPVCLYSPASSARWKESCPSCTPTGSPTATASGSAATT